MAYSNNWQTLKVGRSNMPTFVARPTDPVSATTAPGILVIQHAGGVDHFVQEMTQRLAASGFIAFAPDLYHRQNPPPEEPLARMAKLSDREIVTDSNVVIDHLTKETTGKIGIVGFCMGGRVSYLLAAGSNRLNAAVSFYGGNTRQSWGDGLSPFECLRQIKCPVLGFFGGRDTNPSPQDRNSIDVELTKFGINHKFHTFPMAGHAYMDFTNPEHYEVEAATDSWILTIKFLKHNLASVK